MGSNFITRTFHLGYVARLASEIFLRSLLVCRTGSRLKRMRYFECY